MKTGYLVIDVGTGNLKAVVVDNAGNTLAESRVDMDYVVEDEHACHFIPSKLRERIMLAARQAVKSSGAEIKAVSSTSTRQGIVLVDRQGESFLGLPNIDNRGYFLESTFDERLLYERTGRWAVRYFSAFKLCGLRHAHPELYERIHTFLSVSDWVGYLFTGRAAYEHSQACETMLYDTSGGVWDDELCRIFGIAKDILPALIRSGQSLGTIRDGVAQEVGLPRGLAYIVGSADTQVAVHAAGADEGDTVIVAGTTTPIARFSTDYILDENQRFWTNRHIKKFLLETNAGVTGLNYQRFKKIFIPDMTYQQIENKMSAFERPKMTCCVSTIDFVHNEPLNYGGLQFPLPWGDDLSPVDIIYAMLFSIACEIADNIKILDGIAVENGRIFGVGGGFQSAVLARMVAALIQKPIHLPPRFESASSIGVARLCADHFDEWHYDADLGSDVRPEKHRWIAENYAEWREFRKKLNQ